MTLSSVSPDNTGIAPANPVQSANELAFRLAVANAINASNTVVNGNSLVIDAIQRTNYIRSFDVAQLSVGANTIAILSNAVIAWNNTTELEVTGWPAKTFNTTSNPVEMANNFVGYLWIIWDGASVKDYAITSRLIAPAVNYSLLGLYSINGSGVVSITYALERFFESTPNYWRQPQTFLGGFDRQPPVLTASVAANALTVTAARGSLEFRNATLTNGAITTLYNSSASITIPSGTTLGTLAAYTLPIHVYALNNAGTIELALSLKGNIDTNVLQSTTAISGGTSPTALYSTTARSNVAIAYLGQLIAPQTVAGTWAAAHASIVSCAQSLNKFVTLLDSTVSAVASVTLTSFNANLFKNIQIQGVNIIPVTDDVELLLRTSTDNGATYDAGTGYSTTGFAPTSAGGSLLAGLSSSAFSGILLADSTVNFGLSNVATDLGWNGVINAGNLGSGVHKELDYKCKYSFDGTTIISANGGGMRRTTSVVNGLQLLMTSGNIASGRIIITGELF
jgi:hypothetical protein